MEQKKTKVSLTVLLVVLIIFAPLLVAATFYHEERFSTPIEKRIPAEPVKSITNKFVENIGIGGSGGLGSTDIEVDNVEDFLCWTAGEKVYSTISLEKNPGSSFASTPIIFVKTYASLIKDRSGIYTYIERHEQAGYIIEGFDESNVYWYGSNLGLCVLLWICGLAATLFVSQWAWKVFKRRGWIT